MAKVLNADDAMLEYIEEQMQIESALKCVRRMLISEAFLWLGGDEMLFGLRLKALHARNTY